MELFGGLPLTIFDYGSQVFPPLLMAAVLGPLSRLSEPHAYDLCHEHAARMTPPRGWEIVRLEGVPESQDDNAPAARLGDLVADCRMPMEIVGRFLALLEQHPELYRGFTRLLCRKLRTALDYHNFVLTKYLNTDAVDFQKTFDEALAFGEYVQPMKSDVAGILHDLRRAG